MAHELETETLSLSARDLIDLIAIERYHDAGLGVEMRDYRGTVVGTTPGGILCQMKERLPGGEIRTTLRFWSWEGISGWEFEDS